MAWLSISSAYQFHSELDRRFLSSPLRFYAATNVDKLSDCGMVYYDAAVLKKIEHHFFAIHQHTEEPDCYIEMPTKAYS
jgi:hypothetical protein